MSGYGKTFPNEKKERPYCTYCKIPGHSLGNYSKSGNAEAPVCTHYNLTGNTIKKCYVLHGYPPNHKPYNPGKGGGSSANPAAPMRTVKNKSL